MKFYSKLYELLEPEQQRAAKILLFLMFIGMTLEAMGIGLVIPAITGLANPDLLRNYLARIEGTEFLTTLNNTQLISYGLGFLIFAYVIKTLFLTYLSWRQTDFVFKVQATLSQKMFSGYVAMPYSFHLQRNSANLIRNVITEVQQCTLVVLASTQLLAELLVLSGITILLLSLEPLGALIVMSSFGIAGGILYRLSRKHMLKWGKARQFHEGERLKHLQQGFGGIKDAKLLNRENYFIDTYAVDNFSTARVIRLQYFFQSLPRLMLELLVVIGLAVLICVMIYQERSVDNIIPTIALFAATAFRLMPSANRILSSINSIRYGHPVIETLYNEVQEIRKVSKQLASEKIEFAKKITMEAVTYSYEDTEHAALKNITLSIPRGTSVGFIGQSGAGKSTLIDIILGLISPTSGAVKIDGVDIANNLRAWQSQIGYVPQSIYLTDDTLRKNIAFGIHDADINEERVAKALKAAQLEDVVAALPEGLDTAVGEVGVRLSGGQRQRIGIARALYHDPSVLVLDEATSALDNKSEQEVMLAVNALKKEKTMLIIAHRLSTVAECDHIYRLDKGSIVEEGAPGKML